MARDTLILAKPDLESAEIQRAIRSARPDVILSWFWPRRIPESLLSQAPRGAFGVHPSLLPQWRGPDPYFWALFRGAPYTGVTLHQLARDYDTGDVIAQHRVCIEPSDNAWRLAKRLDTPSLRLLVEAARQLGAGQELRGVPQDDARSSAAPAPSDEQLTIRWQNGSHDIVNQVRALAPYPGAQTDLGEVPVEIVAATAFSAGLPRVLEAGDAVLASRGVVIRAGKGGVLLDRVRLESGEVLRGVEVARLFSAGLFRLPG